VDNAESLLVDSDRRFWLNKTKFEIPTFENADVFVDRLRRSRSDPSSADSSGPLD